MTFDPSDRSFALGDILLSQLAPLVDGAVPECTFERASEGGISWGLADGSRHGIKSYRTPIKLLNHGSKQKAVGGIKAEGVYFQEVESIISELHCNLAITSDLSKVTHTPEQAVYYPGRPAGTPGDGFCPRHFETDSEYICRANYNFT